MTDLQSVRYKIGDFPIDHEEFFTGNGQKTIYRLSFGGIQNCVVTVNSVVQTDITHYKIDVRTGTIVFTTAPTSGHAIGIVYEYSAFTDAEIDDILTDQSNVNSAVLFCIDAMLAESARRHSYSQGQTKMNVNEVFEHFQKLRETYASYESMPRVVNKKSRFYNSSGADSTDLGRGDLGRSSGTQDLSRLK